jgi:transposase
MPKSRKKYTEEFKREAIRAMELRGERTVVDVAKSLGVPENVLHNWRKKLGSQIADTSEETPEQELKRLRREVVDLKREREILKKATAFFAKENS